ncbi:MAG: tetratricopeptide repeat protein [Alphaproteobacteria bacterium]|nr:MAG: tetratricopeptide repeat protein [Alphaproteobacteria bacterium]
MKARPEGGPDMAADLHRRAAQALQRGLHDEALELLTRAVSLQPDNAAIHHDIGAVYWRKGRVFKAEEHYMRAIKLAPASSSAFNSLGALLVERGRLAEAEKCFLRALQIDPRCFEAHHALGNVLQQTNRTELSEKAFRCALELRPAEAPVWIDLGGLLATLGRSAEAADCFSKAGDLDSGSAMPWIRLLNLLEKSNRVTEACQVLAEKKAMFAGTLDITVIEAKLLRRKGDVAGAITLLESCRSEVDLALPGGTSSGYFFELGRLYDMNNDTDKAFASFQEAQIRHGLDPKTSPYDGKEFSALVARVRQDFTHEMAQGLCPPAEPGATTAPVFLVGFPRSGTTLLDQILSSHQDVFVAEERSAVQRMLRGLAALHGENTNASYPASLNRLNAEDVKKLRQLYIAEHRRHQAIGDQRVFVDKMPLNMAHAGLIQRIFPDAKFILALRHPCDAVLSNFMQKFNRSGDNVLHDLAISYDEIFGLWERYAGILSLKVHAIRYEDVVANFRPAVAGLLEFIGVEWNDAVMEFDKTAREKGRIKTPSYHQVTQKIYTRSSGRWLRYRKHLEPVLPILEPWALKYGYSMDDAGS